VGASDAPNDALHVHAVVANTVRVIESMEAREALLPTTELLFASEIDWGNDGQWSSVSKFIMDAVTWNSSMAQLRQMQSRLSRPVMHDAS
jgi:hypothetical protein